MKINFFQISLKHSVLKSATCLFDKELSTFSIRESTLRLAAVVWPDVVGLRCLLPVPCVQPWPVS